MALLQSSQSLLPPSAFKDDAEAPLIMIEVTSNGVARRLKLTEELLETYIEMDFGRTKKGAFPTEPELRLHELETIKFFWSRRMGEYNGEMAPIHISKNMYCRLAPFVRIPQTFPRILVNKTAMSVMATPQLPKGIEGLQSDNARDEYLTFIVHSVPGASNHVCVAASFSYHFPTRHMFVFMHGLASANYDFFSYAIQEGAVKETAFLIPSLVVQFNLEQRVKALNELQDKVYWNERKLGIRFDHHDSPDPASIDYINLSKDLNAANTNIAYLVWSCKATEQHLDFMDSIAKKYRVMAVKHGFAEDEAIRVENLLLETHAYLCSWNKGLIDRAEYLSKRGQALVQTVYSGIAQRDSAISLRLATLSTSLAESSQEVAILTSRDSAVMPVIAAITVLFLPGTFTATFFSFNGNLEGRVYSGWIWLYFVVTIILTALVMVGAWVMWKKKEKHISLRVKTKTLSDGDRSESQTLPRNASFIKLVSRRRR